MKRKITFFYIVLIIAFTLVITGCKNSLYPGGLDNQNLESEISRLETEFDIKDQQIKEFGIIIKNFNLLEQLNLWMEARKKILRLLA